jgi:phage terminase large subunit GpA-like protein
MFEALFDSRNQEVAFQVFSRGGKSRVVLSALGYCIAERPQRILCMWPTLGQAEKWSKDDFMGELVEATPALEALLGDGTGRRKSSSTILHKIFPGGLIDIVGANAPGDLRRAKGSFLYADEIDAIEETSSDEGDQLAIFKKRGAEFADTIEVYCSYPSLKRRSRIEAKLIESDYRQWFVTCIKCGGEPFVMHRSQLRFDRARPQDARLECPNCKALLTDADRYAMMMGGDPKSPRYDLWTPTKEFRGKAGFQANSLLWPHPVNLEKFPGGFLQVLAQKMIDVENSDNPERSRRVLVNTDDAETYESEFEHKPEHSVLFLRREEYDPSKMLPDGVLAVYFGADVQADRIEMEIVGCGEKQQTWGLGYHVLKGSPLAPPHQGVWAEFDRILTTTTFAHPSGKTLRILGGFIDCNYKPDSVHAFTRTRARNRIYSIRGSTQLSKPIISGKGTLQGKPPVRVFEIGTHEAKDIIYQRLELTDKDAPGYCHFPTLGCYSEVYFKGLTIENAEMRRGPDGDYYKYFWAEDGDRNEPLDCRVYAMAFEKFHTSFRKDFYAKLSKEMGTPAVIEESKPIDEPKPEPPKPARNFVTRPLGGGRSNFVTGWRR